MYKVKKEDLIESIKGFPIEVVQKMIERQVEQGNEANVKVFQKHINSSKNSGGFDWDKTEEEYSFWLEVLFREKFNIFFEKYPKEEHVRNNSLKLNNEFKEILTSIGDLLEFKNSNYGNAVLEPLNIFSGKTKAGVRLDDKLSRIKNSEVLRKNDVVDVLGYLVLVCKENNWTNFDEFKD